MFVVAGFILPRTIDHHVGQAGLGIWDFSWSLVSYFGLAQIGIGSSVNRHVAMHRSDKDVEGLRCTVSSVMAVQLVAAVVVIGLTAAAAILTPFFFGDRLGPGMDDAVWVVGLLGAGLAVQMAFDAFRGVITGCHRWDLHNGLNALSYGCTVVFMIVALMLGGGLRALAAINFFGIVLTEMGRAVVAHKTCPELRLRPQFATLERARKMLAFGGKTVVEGLSQLLLIQGSSLIVASYLGPAALAIYARPGSLVRQAQTFINKFAFVLTPTAGSLHGRGQDAELRELVVQTSRFSVALALPIVLFLAIFSDHILRVWMGPLYARGGILVIIACGYFLPLTQRPVVTILTGMNLHGRVGIINLFLAASGIGMGLMAVGTLGWGLEGAALALAIPLAIGNGVLVPIYACRRLKIGIGDYVRQAFARPIACGIPYAVSLAMCRVALGDRSILVLVVGLIAGSLVLGPLYWRYLISDALRRKTSAYIEGKLGLRRLRPGQADP